MRADRAAPTLPLPGEADERPLLDPADRSLEIHACHGRARQVEVLRDAILHLLADDPTLEPRDVIVMCPDIETFAPLIHAAFGAAAPSDDEEEEPGDAAAAARPPDLRVRLADRSLRQTNPVLGVVAELLDLADARVTASQVLDLADRDPVRRRFRLDDDDLARLEDWVTDSGVRWGLDAAHRDAVRPRGPRARARGSTASARVLVGVTMTEDDRRLVGDVLPLDDVDSGAIDLAGRFAELVDRLAGALDGRSTRRRTSARWAAAIAEAADLLTGHRRARRLAARRARADPRRHRHRGGRGAEPTLHARRGPRAARRAPRRPPDARQLPHRPPDGLHARARCARCRTASSACSASTTRSSRAARRATATTCCSTTRTSASATRAPRTASCCSTRSWPRSERLVITYTGNDERTNAARPPAVPVGELLDVVDRTVRTADGAPARERVVVRHPLQPFDPRNFTTAGWPASARGASTA